MSANNCTVHHFTKDIRLLFVENDASTRELMLLILQDFFDTIIVAKDGLEGLHRFYEGNIDLIITDISMPQMDGIEMIQNIRENNPTISIIVFSAYHDPLYFMSTMQYKLTGYILKPVHIDQVKREIRKAIKLIRFEKELEESRLILHEYQAFQKKLVNKEALTTSKSTPQLINTLKTIANPLIIRFTMNATYIEKELFTQGIIQERQILDERLHTMISNYLHPKYYTDVIFKQAEFEYAVVAENSVYLEDEKKFFQAMCRMQTLFYEQFDVILSVNINCVQEKMPISTLYTQQEVQELKRKVSSINRNFIKENAKLQKSINSLLKPH